MKQKSNHFGLFKREKRDPGTLFLSKIFLALMLATLLIGCTTKVYNIKSAGELSGNKLLTGRFVFFNDDEYIENGEGFTVFLKKQGIKRSECFNLMKKAMYI